MYFYKSVNSIVVFSALLAFSPACSQSSKKDRSTTHNNSQNNKSSNQTSRQPELPGSKGIVDPKIIMSDYPTQYCTALRSIKFADNIKEAVTFFCKDGLPTDAMKLLRNEVMASTSRRTPVRYFINKSDESSDNSEFAVVWSYYIADRPFNVKSRPLYEYVVAEKKSEDIYMKSSSTRRGDENLDSGGLHLWSAEVNYDLNVEATKDILLEYNRKTQYNLYQVESGNEEMGLGIEILTNPSQQNFQDSILLNLSFNDGRGYNDGQGETIVLNLLHVKLNNRGFPNSAASAFNILANFIADSVYDGLSRK